MLGAGGTKNQAVIPLLRPSECPCGQQAILLKVLKKKKKALRPLFHIHLLWNQGPTLSHPAPGYKCPLSTPRLNLYIHLFLSLLLEYPAAASLGTFAWMASRPPKVNRSPTRLLIVPLKPVPRAVTPFQ